MDLDAYGWSPERQAAFASDAAEGLIPGRVVGEHRSHLQVATQLDELSAELAGRLRNGATLRSDLAGIGDFVALRTSTGDGPATIERTLPRLTALIRSASGEDRPQLLAANVQVVCIVTAPDGDFKLPRIERFLELVAASGAAPVIVLNKADLAPDADDVVQRIADVAPGVPVHRAKASTSSKSASSIRLCAVRSAVQRGELTVERVALFAAWKTRKLASIDLRRKSEATAG